MGLIGTEGGQLAEYIKVQDYSVADRMRRKLLTKRGRALYSRRKEVVEPVFGQIKQARGFRQFLLRGLTKVQAEWSLICTTHNLLKLWKAAQEKDLHPRRKMGLAWG